jgi:regulator of sigma E protease
MGFLYAIILIGALIFVHELGHFLAAKWCNVKVLQFAIGFGPSIASFQYGETEYSIRMLPLGGYVLMLGHAMDEIEEIPEEDRDRALMAKPIWQRVVVTAAGPAFNLILPVILYFVMTMTLTTTTPSVVGQVFDAMPAAGAGLESGDKIVEIDGEPIDYWFQVLERITDAPGKNVALTYERDGERHEVNLVPETKTQTDFLGLSSRTYGLIGIHPGTYGPTVGIVDSDGPAARAGLQNFDHVLTVNGEAIERYDELEASIRQSNGKPLDLVVLRRKPVEVDWGVVYRQEKESVTVTPERDGTRWYAGVDRAEMFVARVEPDSPAAAAGFEVGDQLTALEGRPYSNWRLLYQQIQNAVNEEIVAATADGRKGEDVSKSFEVSYLRDGETFTTTLEPRVRKLENQDIYRIVIGWGHIGDMVRPPEVAFPFFERVVFASEYSFVKTGEFIGMTAMGFWRMIQGRVSLDNLGGPIMIGELAAQAGDAGWDKYLEMMALISINLAVLNLLPVPMLDGGHLLLYAIEAIKRGPISFRTRQLTTYIGLTFIACLIILAFKNDIERSWDDIAQWVNEL